MLGCGVPPPRMVLPGDFDAAGERMPVSGRVNLFWHRLKFGPYRIHSAWVGVSKGVNTPAKIANDQLERTEYDQRARFDLPTSSGVFHADCRARESFAWQHEKSLHISNSRGVHVKDERTLVNHTRSVHCSLARPNRETLHVSMRDGSVEIQGGGRSLTASAGAEEPSLVVSSGDIAGYLIGDFESALPLAAVDLTLSPAVVLRRDLAQPLKDELAAVAGCLLLLRDLF